MKKVKIDTEELASVINKTAQKGARAISVVLKTDKRLLKKSRETGESNKLGDSVTKIVKYSAMLNFDYENSVNAQREREGSTPNFKVKPNWFFHKTGDARPIIRDKKDEDKKHLQLKVQKVLDVAYFSDNKRVPQNDIEEFLPVKNNGHQGVDKPIICIAPNFENILSITSDGVEYRVVS